MSDNLERKLPWTLLMLRVSIFIVMFVWAIDKLLNPGHAAAIFENFYGIGGLSATIATVLGILQILLCLAFVAGVWKTYTYGAILIMHGMSTLSSFPQYIDAFNNLLFFAAWPMFAACITLFMLREYDTRLSIS